MEPVIWASRWSFETHISPSLRQTRAETRLSSSTSLPALPVPRGSAFRPASADGPGWVDPQILTLALSTNTVSISRRPTMAGAVHSLQSRCDRDAAPRRLLRLCPRAAPDPVGRGKQIPPQSRLEDSGMQESPWCWDQQRPKQDLLSIIALASEGSLYTSLCH